MFYDILKLVFVLIYSKTH